MEIFQALVLGIVQGISEFLPISSSGHLALMPLFFGWSDQGLDFDIALHFGTAVAVIWFFWPDWKRLAIAFWNTLKKRSVKTVDEKLIWYILAATVPAALFGYLYRDVVEAYLRHPLSISYALILTGLFLYLADKTNTKKNLDSLNFRQAILVGLAQVFALIPGISRSGVTILAARAQGFDRTSSARLSFLLATPIIFAATFMTALSAEYDKINILGTLIGVIASALTGYFVIKALLKYIKTHSFVYISWYVMLLGLFSIYFFTTY
jgi:undecaprenyl-diphosphatase